MNKYIYEILNRVIFAIFLSLSKYMPFLKLVFKYPVIFELATDKLLLLQVFLTAFREKGLTISQAGTHHTSFEKLYNYIQQNTAFSLCEKS